ncbi:MAG: chorismate mutase [Oscillospiraceae bacterium]|nr:chorismate mutase [Oscillospiraceae bacterium]
MSELVEKRKQLEKIDADMAELFEKRMKVTESIADYKQKNALPVLDAEREKALLAKNSEYIRNPECREYYVQFMKDVMKLSRDFQTRRLDGRRVAYCGTEGAFAHLAAKKQFPESELVGYTDFAGAYSAVENGECDCAVLPIENSYVGDVGMVMDLMFSGSLFVNGIVELDVVQNLVAQPGVSPDEIKTVVSHPQALEQCSEYIKSRGLKTISYSNTALATQYVKEHCDRTYAAIASEETARIFGMEIIAAGINTGHVNTTRFAVLSRSQRMPEPDSRNENEHFILLFTTKNEAGALVQPLNIIGAHGFNMRNLRSRPRKDLLWNYYFFVEADGNIATRNGKDMMNELSAVCARLKLVGTYN